MDVAYVAHSIHQLKWNNWGVVCWPLALLWAGGFLFLGEPGEGSLVCWEVGRSDHVIFVYGK